MGGSDEIKAQISLGEGDFFKNEIFDHNEIDIGFYFFSIFI